MTGGTLTQHTAPLTDPIPTGPQTVFTNVGFPGPFTEGVIDEGFAQVLRGEDRLVYLGALSVLVQYAVQMRATGALDDLSDL